MNEEPAGGRIFFSSVRRSLEVEDEIRLTSVGVDIGSSTSHLVFSRLVLERLDSRYVVSERAILHESEILLTPYADAPGEEPLIDARALGEFIDRQYALAGLAPEAIDTGALILTGVAVRRANARAIGELFAAQAGKFVSLSAGDALEATLAAFGSGAAALSIRESSPVLNIDIGGGTTKIALCEAGEVTGMTAIDVGARLVCFDAEERVVRIEEAGHRFAREAGLALSIGVKPDAAGLDRMVERMAERIFDAALGGIPSPGTASFLRLAPLARGRRVESLVFSGGVSEYIRGAERREFGDLGSALAREVLACANSSGLRLKGADQGIRATVVGASQYTVQVSGSTIFVAPRSVLPLRNVAVVAPELPLEGETLDPARIAAAIGASLARLDLLESERPAALCYRWRNSATHARLDAFCRGVAAGFSMFLERGLPLVLVGEGDIGGLVGIHLLQEIRVAVPIVSIDGIVLKEFDFIDVGELLETSGAVPVVIKSLVFPSGEALRDAQQVPR